MPGIAATANICHCICKSCATTILAQKVPTGPLSINNGKLFRGVIETTAPTISLKIKAMAMLNKLEVPSSKPKKLAKIPAVKYLEKPNFFSKKLLTIF